MSNKLINIRIEAHITDLGQATEELIEAYQNECYELVEISRMYPNDDQKTARHYLSFIKR